ncbi:beta-glucosidase [Eubacterium sp. am_0171]|uniref:beta-glucosidase n=1 Tax=Faecalicatena contorta TaxID=39482 RepID=A0A173ZQA4_9FIRM|nr:MULTISPECIES: glycoside hydrolase family 3 N-terminal domain-containing protein [Clostridia]MSC84882.1 glycosyl hydrolase [Eubacterium sp. BIOML-A1]MSD07170.1 glycosyl hydrolase [Eubacterium sp. BIOML-A2]RYT16081.1 beta-glucosidase [Eubacterium sp. am_0171]CUN77398.1 Periplasmic beta-glucosidase precursor [[Eubacterium] contortum] [Faecalicatena contorta]
MKKQDKKIRDLLDQMTLEEKVGQLQQCGPSLVGAFEVSFEELLDMMFDGRISQEEFGRLMATAEQDFHEEDLRAGKIGSYNGVGDAATANRLQKIAVEETRLGIPLLFGFDVIHGFRTITPIPLGESCAWDPDLWERTGRMAAEEATAGGVHMTFAPMVDVAKDARWGRVSEGAGEDVLLNGLYGAAKVRGFQGENLAKEDAMAACVKHFAAYGACEAGRDYNRVDMSMQRLWEEYLPSYKMCIDTGARAVMPAFNDINGVPCSVNPWLLKNVLRKQWGFDGMTVSDANAIAECVNHGIVSDKRTAAKEALEAGVDMDMTSNSYSEYLADLIRDGEIGETVLDEAVSNILRVKFELGLFENPYKTSEERESKAFMKPEYRELAREAATKSIVLLKNDTHVDACSSESEKAEKILPLQDGTRLGIFGKLAADKGEMTGAWAIGANPEDCVSLLEACEKQGIAYQYSDEDNRIADIVSESDVLIAVLGEKKDQSGEAASRADITLTEEQLALVRNLLATGKPVVAVLFNGRPLAIPYVAEHVPAIVEAWHPGVEAGNALLDILFGKVNPSGRLTTTFPYASGQCPTYYAHINTGRPGGKSKFTSKYLDTPLEPVFPFGYGLSYTQFEYLDQGMEREGDVFRISLKVKNIGARDGQEVVQCYIQNKTAKRVRPVKELKAFEKINIKAGETAEVNFEIPISELGYYDWDMQYITELQDISFYIGSDSQNCIKIDMN